MQLKNNGFMLLVAIVLFGAAVVPGNAATVTLSFFGEQPNPNNTAFLQTLSGSLSFTYSASSSSISLADLSSFSAVANYDTGHGPGSGTWNYSLPDLLTFSYQPSMPGQVDLTTVPVMSTNVGNGYATPLVISGRQVAVSTGFATITPEPSTATLLALFVGLAALWRLGARKRIRA